MLKSFLKALMSKSIFSIALSGVFLTSCAMSEGQKNDFEILNKVNLDKELKEISGLTYYKEGKLLAIQDEDGKLFLLDENSGEVLNTWKFGKKGDYEGLCVVKEVVYILLSNGDLVRFDLKTEESSFIENTVFSKQEFEGICYHQLKNQLILSCKTNKSSKNKNLEFFSYSLTNQTYSTSALFKISKKDIEKSFGMDLPGVKASGIVQNPINNRFYIIASIGSSLLELNEDFELIKVRALNSSFKQPEGICINSNGELLISNEGQKKQKANIYTVKL